MKNTLNISLKLSKKEMQHLFAGLSIVITKKHCKSGEGCNLYAVTQKQHDELVKVFNKDLKSFKLKLNKKLIKQSIKCGHGFFSSLYNKIAKTGRKAIAPVVTYLKPSAKILLSSAIDVGSSLLNKEGVPTQITDVIKNPIKSFTNKAVDYGADKAVAYSNGAGIVTLGGSFKLGNGTETRGFTISHI